MHYEGKIYRPWMEANSLLIQTTLGCTNNRCTFSDMFRDKTIEGRLPACRDAFLAKLERAIATDPVTQPSVLQTSAW